MIIDTLGCALGGYTGEPSKIARDLASMVTSSRPATVLGGGRSPLSSVLTLSRALNILR